MKPIIKYNDSLLRIVSPFMSIKGIMLFPFIIIKERYRDIPYFNKLKPILINHETIHFKQAVEMLIIPFYIFYILEWIIKLFFYGNKSYTNLSFEREANLYEKDLEYINNRKPYSWIKYIFKPKNL